MIEIIPAIDIISGECVRLSQGDYNRKISYFKDPLEVAKMYEGAGVRRVHVVDLDGAKQSAPVNLGTVEKICRNTLLEVQLGGGIRTDAAMKDVFSAGVSRVICGSTAVKEPDLFLRWLDRYGPDRVIFGADLMDGQVSIEGWLVKSAVPVNKMVSLFLERGLSQIICTDISRDGMLRGPNFELYGRLQKAYPGVNITVSGGVSSMEDIVRLNEMSLHGVIVGKAIYEGRITIKMLGKWLQNV